MSDEVSCDSVARRVNDENLDPARRTLVQE